ncbi:hypothetical protein [Trinickia mobilis]|uniref:hypothetical protein n=1 Tax=Trinickia mobilis TaxID=2816356 RepID=UPI001A902152|nr:hypothetical protein [Trinickia mobilis]
MTRIYSKQDDAEEMDRLCLYLFDGWCERRRVIPLAYLMHAWPILTTDRLARIRLQSALQDLQQFHSDSLTQDDHRIIEQVLAINADAVKTRPEGVLP